MGTENYIRVSDRRGISGIAMDAKTVNLSEHCHGRSWRLKSCTGSKDQSEALMGCESGCGS